MMKYLIWMKKLNIESLTRRSKVLLFYIRKVHDSRAVQMSLSDEKIH